MTPKHVPSWFHRGAPLFAVGVLCWVSVALAQPDVRVVPLSAQSVAALPASSDLLVLTFNEANGSELHMVDPAAGVATRTLVLPGHSTKMAVSDDGTRAYVLRRDRALLTRVDLEGWTMLDPIDVTLTSSDPIPRASSVAVPPGRPDVAVVGFARNGTMSYGGLIVYDDLERLPAAHPSLDPFRVDAVTFGADQADAFGAVGSSLVRFTVDAKGIHISEWSNAFAGEAFSRVVLVTDSLAISNTGVVADRSTLALLGKVRVADGSFVTPSDTYALLTSASEDRVHFLQRVHTGRALGAPYLRTYWLDDLSLAYETELDDGALGLPDLGARLDAAALTEHGVAIAKGDVLAFVDSPLFSGSFSVMVVDDDLDFGTSRVPVTAGIWVRNSGNAPVGLDEVTFEGPFELASAPSEVPPRDSALVEVRFLASEYGVARGAMTIVSTRPDALVDSARVELSGETPVPNPDAEAPQTPTFVLDAPTPNPTPGPTDIRVMAPTMIGRARVVVHDVRGREVAVLHEGPLAAGEHRVPFDASALPSGTYVIRAELSGRVLVALVTVAR